MKGKCRSGHPKTGLELADGKALVSGAHQQPDDLQSSGVAKFGETASDSFEIHCAYMAWSASRHNHKTGFMARRLSLADSPPTMLAGFVHTALLVVRDEAVGIDNSGAVLVAPDNRRQRLRGVPRSFSRPGARGRSRFFPHLQRGAAARGCCTRDKTLFWCRRGRAVSRWGRPTDPA